MLRITVKELKIEYQSEKYTNIERIIFIIEILTILDVNVKYCLTRDIAL